MADYIPNNAYYSDQIKEQEKLREKLDKASYDSLKRGYVIDGEVYTSTELNRAKAEINAKITELKKEERKFGKYGPDFGPTVKSNEAGVEYEKLRKAAAAIEVTDYASAIENLKAWKAVNDFVAANPDIKVAKNVSVLVKNEKGRNVQKTMLHAVPIDAEMDSKEFATASKIATEYAEQGTVKKENVRTKRGLSGAASTYSIKKTVIDQPTLDARLSEIDSINSGTTVSNDIQTAARTPLSTPPGTKGKTTTTRKSGGQSAMTAEQTMAAAAGLSKMNKPTGAGAGGGGTTPGGGGTTPGGGGKITTPKTPKNWEAKFREMFPGNAWMLDIDRSKYSDVFKIFQDAVTNRAWESETSVARFKAQLENSSFMKELKTTNKVSQIKGLVGDLGFDTVPFNTFLTKAMNMGWDDVTLKQEAYKEAFRKDDTGKFVNPTALTRVRSSNDYLTIQKIGKDFFSSVSDDTIQQVLIGGMTQEDVQRQQRELAKSKYGHLSNLIDQGFTLDTLSSSFKQQAAALLEKDPNSIDMSQADYEQVLNYGEEGKKRLMTTGEWEIKLRSDPRYNWISTQNAKAEARQLSASIAQAFGKVI